jgi:hypothetical protein
MGLLYYLFNELEDECVRNTWKKHTWFFNTNESWRNKWDEDDITKERFWGSSTIFVFVTDGEHMFQWLKNRMINLGFLIIGWEYMVAWIIGQSIMSGLKETVFKKWIR